MNSHFNYTVGSAASFKVGSQLCMLNKPNAQKVIIYVSTRL